MMALARSDLYCRYHNIYLPNKKAFNLHREYCKVSVGVKNLCTVVRRNGEMCGLKFKHVASLILHCKRRHSLLMCAHCDVVRKTMAGLERHRHVGPIDVHESE